MGEEKEGRGRGGRRGRANLTVHLSEDPFQSLSILNQSSMGRAG